MFIARLYLSKPGYGGHHRAPLGARQGLQLNAKLSEIYRGAAWSGKLRDCGLRVVDSLVNSGLMVV